MTDKLVINNWDKIEHGFEEVKEKQRTCDHQFVDHILLQYPDPNMIGSKSVGHLRCRNCGKHADLYSHPSHTEEEWEAIEDDKHLQSLLPK